jgi:hypothetical protein
MLGCSPSTVQCMYTRCFRKTSVGDVLGLPDPDPLVRGMGPAPDPSLFS